jgi:hypothetical protein
MNDYGGNLKDKNVDGNVESKLWAHKMSGGNEDSTGNWTKGHSCNVLQRICIHFVSVLRFLNEAEFKNN